MDQVGRKYMAQTTTNNHVYDDRMHSDSCFTALRQPQSFQFLQGDRAKRELISTISSHKPTTSQRPIGAI